MERLWKRLGVRSGYTRRVGLSPLGEGPPPADTAGRFSEPDLIRTSICQRLLTLPDDMGGQDRPGEDTTIGAERANG
jgi:hypothetical protein